MVVLINTLDQLAKVHSLPTGSVVPILVNDNQVEELEILENEFEAMEELLHKNIALIPISFLPEIIEVEDGVINLF